MTYANWYLEVEVYMDDGVTMIADLPRRWDVSCQESLNVAGVGSVTIAMDDAIWARHPSLLAVGHWVKFRLSSSVGNKVISAFQIRNKVTTWVADSEWQGFTRTVSGPTAMYLLNDFIIKHALQPPADTAGEDRAFDWTSVAGAWFDNAQWSDSYISQLFTSHISDVRDNKPKNLPDKTAYWLHEETATWEFYRSTGFSCDGKMNVGFYVAADESYKFYVDGDVLIDRQQHETGFKKAQYKEIVLEDGPHVLAMVNKAVNSGIDGDGVDPWIMSCYRINSAGDRAEMLFHSGPTGWKLHAGLPAPGWRKAEMLIEVISEAQDRGNDSALKLSFGFTNNKDSDNLDWDDEQSRTVRVGTKVLDFVQQLCEGGGFDVWVDPDDFKIYAWKQRGNDLTQVITFEPGRNLSSWTIEKNDEISNNLLVKYDGGWTERKRQPSIDRNGSREDYVELGNVNNEQDAKNTAKRLLLFNGEVDEKTGTADTYMVKVEKKPTGGLYPVEGAVPFWHFGIGAIVSAYNDELQLVPHRIISLSLTEDEDGALTFDPDVHEWTPEDF